MTDAENADHRLAGSEIHVPFAEGDNIVDVLDDWGRAFFAREIAALGPGYIPEIEHYPDTGMIGLRCVPTGVQVGP